MSPTRTLKSKPFQTRKRYVFLCQSSVPINKKSQEYVVVKTRFTPLNSHLWSLRFINTISDHFLNASFESELSL